MTKKPTRQYTPRTLKLLFGRSGNQCAHPDCSNPVVVDGTPYSDAHVSAQICHILPVGRKGPRASGNVGNRNEAENLILLCPTHHGIIDGQFETYPSELLREWKRSHEAKVAEIAQRPFRSLEMNAGASAPDATTEIERLELILRQTRFYTDGRTVDRATSLAARLLRGDLSGGPSQVRSHALGWCSRALTFTEANATGQECLRAAETLALTEPVEIAQAFEQLANGDKSRALEKLGRRSSPAVRSATLFVATHKEPPEAAVRWFESSGLRADELDPDGKFALISRCLLAERWELLPPIVTALTEADFIALPVLLHQAALIHLLPSVPSDLRRLVISQPPFEVATFPLSSDQARIEERRIAMELFDRAAGAADELESRNARSVDSIYALWLALRDPDEHETAKGRLQESLRQPDKALGFVPLAVAFGLPLNLEAVEREIGRRISIYGHRDVDAATARFALSFTQSSPGEAAAYLNRHRAELIEILDPVAILAVEVELLTGAGLGNEASARLEEAGGILSPELRLRLEAIVANGRRDPDVDQAESEFAANDGTPALAKLVEALTPHPTNPKLLRYARSLFERTRALADAERLVALLTTLELNEELGAFFRAEADLVPRSLTLRASRAWHNYRLGNLKEAKAEIDQVRNQRSDQNDRMLVINIALTGGTWDEVAAYIEEEWRDRENREAGQLLWAANLAGLIGLPRKKEFLFLAAQMALDDAQIQASAYFMAISFGLDDDPEVTTWLSRAAELSGEDGPLQKISLAEIIERKPAWDRQEQDTWDQITAGTMPLFVAGKLLNRSSVDLQLRLMIRNAEIADPRRRAVVPLFSGSRQRTPKHAATIALDATALLTLAYLDLLPLVWQNFGRVILPHSTLTWLLEERRRAAFHQPSQVKDAHLIRSHLATGKLRIFSPTDQIDLDLSDEVGEDLAALLASSRNDGEGGPQRLVVRSLPVTRVGSLSDEEADLSEFRDRICSCTAVINKLVVRGKLSRAEETRARAYLRLHEQPRAGEPEIRDGAELLLDDLAVSYLEHLGLLGRLADAGFTATISQREATDADNLIAYEQVADKVVETIDRLRTQLAWAISSGGASISRVHDRLAEEDGELRLHPTYGAMSLADDVDAIVIDDRAINRHARVDGANGHAEIWDSLDVIDALKARGALKTEEWLDHRASLRRAGAVFVPITADELRALLAHSAIVDSDLAESAELRAIRESILVIQMGRWLQLPAESGWLDKGLSAFGEAIKVLWATESTDVAKAQSRWLIQFMDLRAWAGRVEGKARSDLSRHGYVIGLMPVIMTADPDDPARSQEFQAWLSDEVLDPLDSDFPQVAIWLAERVRSTVDQFVADHIEELAS